MPDNANSEHRAMGWAAIGGGLMGVGALVAVSLGVWGAGSHLWNDDYFLAGFAAALLLTLLGLYVLWAEFIGGIGPIKFPLPPTRRERETRSRYGTDSAGDSSAIDAIQSHTLATAFPVDLETSGLILSAYQQSMRERAEAIRQDMAKDQPESKPGESKEPVSPAHRDMLKGVAACLLSYLRASQMAYYGRKGDEHKAQAFQEHFPEIRAQVDNWNARIEARERARDELRSWVAGRLHALHYDQAPFGGGLDNPIVAEALADAPRLNFKEVLGCLHIGPCPVVVLPSMKTLDPSWAEIPKIDRGRVERELQEIAVEAAGREERQRARDSDKSLPEVGDSLVSELELIQEKDVIRGLGDCALCR